VAPKRTMSKSRVTAHTLEALSVRRTMGPT
jgi:hypothetical protein